MLEHFDVIFCLISFQQVINSFEEDMAQALEVVRRERDEAESSVEEMRSKVFWGSTCTDYWYFIIEE